MLKTSEKAKCSAVYLLIRLLSPGPLAQATSLDLGQKALTLVALDTTEHVKCSSESITIAMEQKHAQEKFAAQERRKEIDSSLMTRFKTRT